MEPEINTYHEFDFSDRLFKLAVAAIVVGAVFLAVWAIYQFSSLPQNTPQQVTVTGTGMAYVKPDVAMVGFGVTTQAAKSQDAVNQNNTKMNAVITAIESQGVAAADIQTTSYNLSPVYGYSRIAEPNSLNADGMAVPTYIIGGQQVLTGYSLDQEISVKIRNFDNIDTILSKATSAGATNVGSLQFTVDNPETAQAAARALAIANAKQKMEDIAKESGLQIGKLIDFSEDNGGGIQPMYAVASGAMNTTASVAPQIQTGQQEVDSTVTLTYQVK